MIQICGVTLNKNNELTLRACVWDKTGSRYTYDHEAHKAVIWRMLEEQVPEIVSSEEFRREFREKSVTALIKELRRNPNDAWEFEEIAERAFKKDKTSYQQRVSELYQQSIDLKNQAKELKRRAKFRASRNTLITPDVPNSSEALQTGPAQSRPAFADPPSRQSAYPSSNLASLPPTPPPYRGPGAEFRSSQPPATSLHGVRGVPQQSPYAQPHIPRPESSYMSGEYEYQLPLLTGNPGYQPSDPGGDDRSQRSFSQASESDDQQPRSRGSNTWWNRPTRNHPQHPPSDAPPARDNPFSAKSRTSGSQSGHGQAQREAPGVLQIGNNKFNSLIEYLAKDYEGKATQPKCTSRGLHVIENDYGANEFRMLSDGTREPASPHSRANYQAWSRQASAKLESKPSESSSSPSGGSEQHQAPRRRRLDDEGSEGEAEQSQRYAAARQEKSKKDKKGDKHRRHHPKK